MINPALASAIIGALLLGPLPSTAQTMYKCTDANGVTAYSQLPCSTNPDKQTEITVKTTAPPELSDGELAGIADRDRRVRTADANYREDACVRAGIDSSWRIHNRRIADYDQEIAVLQTDTRRAKNNLAGATWQAGLRDQISVLNQLIAAERASADADATQVRKDCAERRKQELAD